MVGGARSSYHAVIHYRNGTLCSPLHPHVRMSKCTANMRDVKVHQSVMVDARTSELLEATTIGEGGRWREICQSTEEDKQALADLKRNR